MPKIVAIVEGYGEVAALPILLRRIGVRINPHLHLEVPQPIRVKRQKVLKSGELERAVELAGRQTGPGDRILILLDADRDCPATMGPEVFRRARRVREDRSVSVVLAKAEYEAWFLAAATSLAGIRGLDETFESPPDPEAIRDPKGWLTRHMRGSRAYRETLDQAALTAAVDLETARISPSFDKLWRELESLLRAK